ncbi:MAG: 4Fe-4S dicluster domain-containing protein [Bacillota bacterium]
MRYGILVDHTKCITCEACTVHCRELNEPPGQLKYTRVKRIAGGSFPRVFAYSVKSACMHCAEATCTLVCPSGAMHKTPEGAVVTNPDRCIGCNYCAANCPFQVPQFLKSSGKAYKCTFCAPRLVAGQVPWCADACLTGAIKFGKRADMVAEGTRRVNALKQAGVAKAQLYGESQLGGLSVLTVLRDDPAVYGLAARPRVPAGAVLWRYLTKPLGGVAVAGAAAVVALNWMVSRRMQAGAAKEGKV